MNTTTARYTRAFFIGAILVAAVVVGVILSRSLSVDQSMPHAAPSQAPEQLRLTHDGSAVLPSGEEIPLPFEGAKGSGLAGSIVNIGRNVYRVDFPSGTDTETLEEDTIYLVYLPADATISAVPLDDALTLLGTSVHDVNYYGYRYTSISATTEKERRSDGVQEFNQRFPGAFFASAQALSEDIEHNNSLATFATNNDITWYPTDAQAGSVELAADSLILLIVNEPNGVEVRVRETSTLAEGSLFVTRDATPVRSRQLLGGVLNEPVLRLNFRADVTDMDVTKISVAVDNEGQSVDRLELFEAGETEPFAYATVAACGTDPIPTSPVVTFCARMDAHELVIPGDLETDVIVKPRMKTDVQGALASQTLMRFFVPAHTGTWGAYQPITAYEASTGIPLAPNDGDETILGELMIGHYRGDTSGYANADIVGSDNNVVMSKISVVANASSDPNDSLIGPGVSSIGRFGFFAANNANTQNGVNAVLLREITFSVLHQNMELDTSSFKVFNHSDQDVKAACSSTASTVADTLLVHCNDLTTISHEVAPNDHQIFVLEANVLTPVVNTQESSLLKVSFGNFHDIHRPRRDESGTILSHILWTDADTVQSEDFSWLDFVGDDIISSTRYRGLGTTSGVCGNGTAEGSEQCDDGNTVNDDTCDNTCHQNAPAPAVCGNGTVEGSEQCDDGNTVHTDDCNNQCEFSIPVPSF